ncbi:hypothetical protein K9L05_02300 [Candidatus Babeliales bacterium]|nr:hypothetical protein [Candidatus Babeliales bacterium]MCF7899458.1 hypothetical protein [Candidatus Babeliales bacterium]
MKNFKKVLILIFLIFFSKIRIINPEIQIQEQIQEEFSENSESNILDNFSSFDNLSNLRIIIQNNLTKLKTQLNNKLSKETTPENPKINFIDLGEFLKIHDSVFQILKNINWKFEKSILEQIEQIKNMILEYIKQTGNTFIPLDKEILKFLENSVKEYVKESDVFWQQLSVAGKFWHKGPEFLKWKLWHDLNTSISWKKFERLIFAGTIFPFKFAYKSILKLTRFIFNSTKKLSKEAYQKLADKKIFKLAMLYVSLCLAEIAFEYKHSNNIRISDIQYLNLTKLKEFCEKIYLGFNNGSNNLFLKRNFDKFITQLSNPNFSELHKGFAPYMKKIYNAIYGLITGHNPVKEEDKGLPTKLVESWKTWLVGDYSLVKTMIALIVISKFM